MRENIINNLLLDRAYVIESALSQTKSTQEDKPISHYQRYLKYKRWFYESDGVSAIEHVLRSNPDWNQRLVSIPLQAIDEITTELKQLEYSITEWSKSILIQRSIQLFEKSHIGAPRSAIDYLSYLMRLLYLSHKFNADILAWWPRVQLFKAFFETAGFDVEIRDLDDQSSILLASGQDFHEGPDWLHQLYRLNLPVPGTAKEVKEVISCRDAISQKKVDEPIGQQRVVFLSYSHKDKVWLDRLLLHMKPLFRSGHIKLWSDRDIKIGDNWRAEIANALSIANIALLLVSPNFVASDFIARNELPPLLERAQKGGVKLFWIAVSSSLYEETALEKYQAANDPQRPLDLMSKGMRNRVFVSICKFLKEM